MGTEAVWIPLVAAALGTATTVYSQKQAANKQDDQLSAQLSRQRNQQKQADARTAQLIDSQGKLTDTSDKASSLAKFTQAIQTASPNVSRPIDTQGAVSDRYQKAGSDAVLGVTNTGSKFANLVSSIDAPLQARDRNQRTLNQYANDIGMIRRNSSGDDYLDQMRLHSIRPNPWLAGAGSLASSYGRNYSGGGSGASGYNGFTDVGGGYTLG